MSFNFMVQWNVFHRLCDAMLPIKAQLIYYKLLNWGNNFNGNPFRLTNQRLMLECQIFNENTFITNRNLLKNRGFIDFKAGKKGCPTTYFLLDLTKLTFNTQVNIEVDSEVDTAGDSAGDSEVDSEVNTEVDTAGDTENLLFTLNHSKPYETIKENIKENDAEKAPDDFAEVIHEWENLFGTTINSVRYSQLQDLLSDFGKDIAIYAIQKARKRNINSMMYVRGIAKNESGRRNGADKPDNGTGVTDPYLQRLYEEDQQRQADEIRTLQDGGNPERESLRPADAV